MLSLAAAAPAVAAAAPSIASVAAPGKGFKIATGEGRLHGHLKLHSINSNILDLKIAGQDTAGALAIFEQTSLSPKRGTPLHVHPLQDEVFYVMEGAYRFQVGEERFSLQAGDSIFLPRQVPHAWTQVSERGRMTVTFQPAGKMEAFFVALAAFRQEPIPAEIKRLFADHEMQIVGPPLAFD